MQFTYQQAEELLEQQDPLADNIFEPLRDIFHAKPIVPTITSEPIYEISASLAKFRADHPDQSKVGFIMTRFATTPFIPQLRTASSKRF
jgi:hypothetical protein